MNNLLSSRSRFARSTLMRNPLRRLARLRNTLSVRTFPSDLSLLGQWPKKTNEFLGMNHDFMRASIILRLMGALDVDAFVETGTHLGRTCFLVAAQTDLLIYSCEVNEKYLRIARWLLKPFGSRIHVSNTDSVAFLHRLIAQHRFRRPLFYLDAHWYSRLPLRDELFTILQSLESFVVVIDDFRVPEDVSFGFDRYGTTVLEWSLIEQVLTGSGRRITAYFPAYPSSMEVGDRRGWILIASSDNEIRITETVPSNLLGVHALVGHPAE